MLKKLHLFLFFIIAQTYSQVEQPIDTTDFEIRKKLIENYEKTHEVFYKKLKKKYKSKLRKQLTLTYKSIHKEFLGNVKKKRFIFDERFTNYTDSLLSVLTKHNPALIDENLKVYISKNPTINAMDIGDNIIILNIGLFKYLKNEAQLMSVIAHEIAHKKEKHVEKNIIYGARLSISKQKKIQAKKIRREKYNQYDKAFKIMKNLMYENKKIHRKKEMQADSIGYLLYKNTSYPEVSYVNSLKLIARYDSLPEIELDSTMYKLLFDLPNQPFKNEWLKMEGFSDYEYSNFKEKINKDSIKSHPDLIDRILKLQNNFTELNNESSLSEKQNSTFKKLQKIAKQEDISNLFYLKNYGTSIRLAIYKLKKKPNDLYIKKWIGKNFLALYEAKKKYQLNRHIEIVKPKDQSKNHQQFLNFLWNLSLEEIKNIGEFYSDK